MAQPHIQEEIVALTSELIRIPSVHSRPDEISRCADFIGDWLTAYNMPCQRIDEQTHPSLLVSPTPDRCPILLMSHFDVVEAEEQQFIPHVQEGRLYGRGAIDDKYAIALMLILYRETWNRLKKTGQPPEQMAFGLLFTGDEEVGGANGAGLMAERFTPDYFLALDGGRPESIITKEKGILSLSLAAQGKAAHAARPWLGESGFDILVKDYLNLQEIFSTDTPDHWHPTLVLSNCQAGSGSTNMVPATATATLDIRYTEHDDPNQLLQLIRDTVRSAVSVRAMEPVFLGGDSPYTDLLCRFGNATTTFEHGASDARYFSSKKIPGAVWGADGEMSQHTASEHVVIQSLYDVYDSLQGWVDEIMRQRGS